MRHSAIQFLVLAGVLCGFGMLTRLATGMEREWTEAAGVGAQIEQQTQGAQVRNSVKRGLADDAAAGRIDLREAALGFLAVDDDDARGRLRRAAAGRTDLEREARSVLNWVGACHPHERGRLERQFADLFQSDGPLALAPGR